MTSHPLRERRILCVEDEYYLAMELGRDLKTAGAVVLGPVPSVERALALIDSEPGIDAAVLDINLGGAVSYAVADALARRDIPFVFMTGYSEDSLQPRYPDVAWCEKPVDFQKLVAALVAALPTS